MSSEMNIPGSAQGVQPNKDDESETEKREGLDRATPEDRDDYVDPDTMPEQEPAPSRPEAANAKKFSRNDEIWAHPGRRW